MGKPTVEAAAGVKKDNAVYLIDASVYVFRAWFALPDTLKGRDDRPINAVHGFTQFLFDFLQKVRPRELAVAFDESLTTSHRNDIYPAYKANREPAPAELKAQFRACREMTEALGIAACASDRYEADDLIGTLAAQARVQGKRVVVVSRDKDLAQLIGEGDELWDFGGKLRVDARGVHDHFGVHPRQMLDFQALMGDAVDNVPGVRGIGSATAALLLKRFADLDAVFASLVEVEKLQRGPRLRQLLEAGRDSAYLSRDLCRVVCDVPMPPLDLAWKGADAAAVSACCARIGLGQGLQRRLASLPSP